MRVLHQVVTEPHTCQYLPDRDARLEYLFTPWIKPAEYERLMNEGYRKFGAVVFRPVCHGCQECRPIRIPVDEFRPDRSQRRAWKRNHYLEIRYAPPTVDDERLDLYHRYHEAQSERKGWAPGERDEEDYAFTFVQNPVPAVEISMWDQGRLQAVVLTETTPNILSGIYHFYDPALYPQGVGTYCMLHTLDLARRMQKRWAYFGFYVAGCGSLAYKARFRPCEILGRDGEWVPG